MWLRAFFACLRSLVRITPLLPLALTAVPAAAAPVPLGSLIGPPVLGTWRTPDGTEITITPCGQGYCGALTWIVIPRKNADQCRTTDHDTFATLILDYNNPDRRMQTRPLLGLNMMTLRPTGDPNTFTARVYNPQDGSTNDVQVFILNGGSTLRIGGACLGGMCAVTQDWPRAPDRPDAPGFTCEGGQ